MESVLRKKEQLHSQSPGRGPFSVDSKGNPRVYCHLFVGEQSLIWHAEVSLRVKQLCLTTIRQEKLFPVLLIGSQGELWDSCLWMQVMGQTTLWGLLGAGFLCVFFKYTFFTFETQKNCVSRFNKLMIFTLIQLGFKMKENNFTQNCIYWLLAWVLLCGLLLPSLRWNILPDIFKV